MPKEGTHYLFADLCIKRVKTKNPNLYLILNSDRKAFYSGSAVYDTAFYSISKQHSPSLLSISSKLHGSNGENTLSVLQDLWKFKEEPFESTFFSFICGMLTHYSIDTIMHPLIFHLTGNLFSENPVEKSIGSFNHRFLEGIIDCKLAKHFERNDINNINIRRASLTDQKKLKFIFEALVKVTLGEKKLLFKNYVKTFKFQLLMLNLFKSASLRQLSKGIHSIVNAPFIFEFIGLFYNNTPTVLSKIRLDEPITYKNPVSGEIFSHSILELLELAYDRWYSFFTDFTDLYTLDSDFPVGKNAQPYSLDNGLICGSKREMTFFNLELIEKLKQLV